MKLLISSVTNIVFIQCALLFPMLVSAYELRNPLAFDNLQDFFIAIMNALIVLSIPFIVLFIILAGFFYVTARGNPEKIQTANKALLYAIIGGLIIIGSITIMAMVDTTVREFGP